MPTAAERITKLKIYSREKGNAGRAKAAPVGWITNRASVTSVKCRKNSGGQTLAAGNISRAAPSYGLKRLTLVNTFNRWRDNHEIPSPKLHSERLRTGDRTNMRSESITDNAPSFFL